METKDIFPDSELDITHPESLPIPDPDFLKELAVKKNSPDGKLVKYVKEYEYFCKWSALPTAEREPKTAIAWEKRYKVERGYTFRFKLRKDFQNKRLTYFWDWMMDKFPDVVYAMYQRAMNKSSVDARAFAELISKHIDIDKPIQIIQPLAIIGVAPEKINKLFVPKSYEDVKGVIPIDEK